jgi:hypothetical protein
MKGVASFDRMNERTTERAIVHALQANGIAAEKISATYMPGADLNIPLLGIDRGAARKFRFVAHHDQSRLVRETIAIEGAADIDPHQRRMGQ